MSVPSALIESNAISPTFVILLSPKLVLSPKLLLVSVSADTRDTNVESAPAGALPTIVSVEAGNVNVTLPE